MHELQCKQWATRVRTVCGRLPARISTAAVHRVHCAQAREVHPARRAGPGNHLVEEEGEEDEDDLGGGMRMRRSSSSLED